MIGSGSGYRQRFLLVHHRGPAVILPRVAEVFTMTMLGFALVEAIALFALVIISLLILFG